MTWKPSEDHDREIRRWMESKGWKVNATNYNSEHEIYAWRHELRGGKSPTLRISRNVLETYPAFIVTHHLEQLKVARQIRARPEARLVVVQNGPPGQSRGGPSDIADLLSAVKLSPDVPGLCETSRPNWCPWVGTPGISACDSIKFLVRSRGQKGRTDGAK